MQDITDMSRSVILNFINTELRDQTLSHKSTVFVNWELNNKPEAAARAAGYNSLAEKERRHGIAVAVVNEWAKAHGRTGRGYHSSRKSHIRRLVRDFSTREQMAAAMPKQP